MKKIMMAMLVVAFAATTQASMVYWSFMSSVNNATYFETAQNLDGYTAYLVLASDWNTSDVAGSLDKAQASVASSAWTRNTYESPKAQFMTGNLTATGLDLTTGTADFYVILSDGANYWASQELMDVTVLEDGSISTDYTAAKVALSGTSYISTSAMQAIPEPTSGLLLLLGMASLALRRKQA
jgi:hypothetical protein